MRVLVGLSGGLDSCYAVYKLRLMGHMVEGAVIKMHSFTETEEAERVALALGIPCHIIDATEIFEEKVVSYFVEEYKRGRTPNPCIVCNSDVKFKILCDYAEAHGFDKIATGHYAELVELFSNGEKRYAVKRSADDRKDQSYVLWRLPQKILLKLIFPLFEEKKSDIRKKASDAKLYSSDRGESQEICFIPDNDYASFIENRAGKSEPGDFISADGKTIGKHKGIIHYTVGQRKGLGISLGERAFVTKIDPENNTITLDTADSYTDKFYVNGVVFSGLAEPEGECELTLDVKHRYLAPLAKARVKFIGDNRALVLLEEKIRAVTPGQSAVFYRDGAVMAGGFIE